MGLKLILARSSDGYLAKGPDDDMTWTGSDDKLAFRLLTSTGGMLGVGSSTFRQMPLLRGREMIELSQRPKEGPWDGHMTLEEFHRTHTSGWLIGGPTVAQIGLKQGFVSKVYVSHVQAKLGSGIEDKITPWLQSRGQLDNKGIPWRVQDRIDAGSAIIDVWRPWGVKVT